MGQQITESLQTSRKYFSEEAL